MRLCIPRDGYVFTEHHGQAKGWESFAWMTTASCALLTLRGWNGNGRLLRIWSRTVFKVSADYYDQYLLLKLDDLKSPEGDRVFLR